MFQYAHEKIDHLLIQTGWGTPIEFILVPPTYLWFFFIALPPGPGDLCVRACAGSVSYRRFSRLPFSISPRLPLRGRVRNVVAHKADEAL